MEESKGIRFSEALKLHVVDEVESGRISQSAASRKYGILGHSTILKWCRKYGKYPSEPKQRTRLKTMNERDRELLERENEIKELKKELEAARLKNIVLETLVDVAERELAVPIRKKYGAKRSGK